MEHSVEEKTGKPLAAWIQIVKTLGLEKHGQIVAFLKSEHGITHGYANLIAHKALKSDAGSSDADSLVEAQYSKGKEHLRPILDVLSNHIKKFGDDIEFAPKRANVSVRRKKQFLLIQPSTKPRMDLGLKLKGVETTDRLENSGPFGSMCTHRVRVEAVTDIDDELLAWIHQAYEMAS